MKPIIPNYSSGQWVILPLIVIGLVDIVFATPQSAPSGDAEIAEFIQMDVRADRKLQGSDIKVRIENGIAILTGSAGSLAQAERATARAIASEGVNVVLNQVQIKPASGIAENAKSALRSQKMFQADDVAVSVSGSRITLAGKVGALDEKDLAREIVSEVPGVMAIDNQLTVTFEGIREDARIAAQLQFLIKDDPLYEGLDLTASVKSGTVSLSGQVGSRGEYDRLIRRSYVTGVTEVQVSDFSIESDLAMEGLADKDYTKEQSLEAFQAALNLDSRIDAKSIHASMDDGTLVLKGSVRQIAESDAVESTARGIPGVLQVSNGLKISGGSQMAVAKRDFKAASPPLVKKPR